MDFVFANPAAINWLWLVVALLVLAVAALRGRAKAMRAFADHPLLERIAPAASVTRPALRAALALGGLAALVLAIMDPRWGAEVEEVKRRGAEVFLLIDVSRSMTAQDATPSRLERARLFAEDIVDSLAGDRAGLIEFAGTAALRTPLTLNYGALRMQLQDLKPLTGSRGGTALANAIDLAVASFPPTAATSRAIVIMSDGEDLDTGESPVKAAQRALDEHGVHVYTVGIGDSHEGGRIPVLRTGGAQQYLVYDGQEVWTKMNETTLRDIAAAGGGDFIPAGTRQVDMASAYRDTVGKLEKKEFESATVTRRTPRFQWFAMVAFVLLLASCILPDRPVRAAEVAA